jgi:Cys-tRNA(Pro)/Cys-tRNA(Cys) deacylase
VAGQATPAIAALARQRVEHRVHPYSVDADTPNYGGAVADALGVAQARVFKTLVAVVFYASAPQASLEGAGVLTVAVVPVTGDLDLKALAGAVNGKRAGMADRAVAERTTGYVRGGISPLGQRKRLPTVIDASATDHETVYVSAGRRGLQVELKPADLIAITDAVTARIAS